jgi:hypothetical protein
MSRKILRVRIALMAGTGVDSRRNNRKKALEDLSLERMFREMVEIDTELLGESCARYA